MIWWFILLCLISISIFIIRILKPYIYDRLIVHMTTPWYQEVFESIDANSKILDVGVGTGGALINNSHLIKEKHFDIVGIDIDKHYVKRCRKVIKNADLEDQVHVVKKSLYDYRIDADDSHFDAVYFSDSLMLIPHPIEALKYSAQLINYSSHGRIYITQTVETKEQPWLDFIKPHIKWLTTIDFGRVTYEQEFFEQINSAGLKILSEKDLTPPLGGFGRGNRRYIMLELQPNNAL